MFGRHSLKINFIGLGLASLSLILVMLLPGLAKAADQVLTAVGTDTALTAGAGNTIKDLSADTDTAEIDVNGNVVFGDNTNKSVDFDANSGTLFVFDSADGGSDNAADNTLTFGGDTSIVAGKTLSIIMGDDEDGGTGAVSVSATFDDASNADQFIAGADATTRGGNLILDTVDNIATNIGTNTMTIDAQMLLTTVTIKSGDGGSTGLGAAMVTTLGSASGDAIDLTGLVITGGAGAVGVAGGANTVTSTGTLAIGSGGVDINAGAGGTTGVGGSVKLTVTPAVTAWSGDTTIDAGAAGSTTGAGATAELELSGNFSGTGAFTVTGGIGASGAGTGDGGNATLDADGTFTTTKALTFQAGNAGAGTTDAAVGGQALGTLAGNFSALGLSITGGNGGDNAASNGGAADVTQAAGTFAVGATGLSVVGGNGGADAGASIGGAATLTTAGVSTITGDIAVTGGNGNANDAADGGAATATFTDDVTATAQTLTITGGDGHASSAGDGGAAKVEFIASGTFTSVVLNDGTAGTATAGGATLEFDAAANETFTGAVTVATDGHGTINVENSNVGSTGLTMASQIGTDSLRLKALNIVDGAAATKGTFSADAYVDTITVDSTNGAATGDFNADVYTTAIVVTDGASGNVATANFAKSVTGTITITDNGGGDDGLVVFDGTTAQTVAGAVAGAAGSNGNVQISNTTAGAGVTFSSALSNISDVILDASSITTFDSTVGTATVTAGDAPNITLAGTVTAATSVTLANTNSTTITVAKGQTYGSASAAATDMVTSGDIVFTGTTANTITVNLPSDFQSGHLVLFNDSDSDGISAGELAAINPTDTALVDYAAVDGGAAFSGTTTLRDIVITATRKSAAAAAAELGVTADAAQALGDAATALTGVTGATDIATQTALTNALATGGETARKAAATVQGSPASSTAAGSAAVTSTGTQVIAVGSTRLASLRSGPAYASSHASGFAAGQDVLSKAVWMKPFVNFADQNRRKGIAGYETETYGAAIGGDIKVGNSTFGVSFSYANTDVDSKGDGNAQTDVDSYQGTFYADYTTKDWYVEGLFGYARNEISGSRSISINNLTANNDFGSDQYMGNIGFGMPVEVDEGHFITPNASIQYTMVDNETYTETGAGALNLRVDQDNVHQALGVFGLKYHTNSETDSGTFTPELRLSMTYDFANDEAVSTSNFTGGGPTFNVEGADVQEFGTRAGAGFSFMPLAATGLTIAANYDVWAREDFVSHSANASLRFDF